MHCVCMHRSGTEHRLPLRDLVVCRQRLCGVPSPRSTSVPGRMGCHGINATARRVRGCAVVLGSHWQGVATAAGQHVSCLLKGSVDFACTHDVEGPGGRDNTGVGYTTDLSSSRQRTSALYTWTGHAEPILMFQHPLPEHTQWHWHTLASAGLCRHKCTL